MPRRKNKVLIEWMDSSCKGEKNQVNVKHILTDAEDITVGAVVMVRINSRKYKGMVQDPLELLVPQNVKRKRKAATKEENEKKSVTKEENKKPAMKEEKEKKPAENEDAQVAERLYICIQCKLQYIPLI